MIKIKQLLAISVAIGTAALPHAAKAQINGQYGNGSFQMRFGKPDGLGLRDVAMTPAAKYDRVTTKKILDGQRGHRNRATGPTVTVLYDSTGTYGWLGDLYSQQMQNLLSHFPVNVNRIPVESYTAGMMDQSVATFYMGLLYDNPLPAAFTADAMKTTKPLCWMGYNLWKIAWNADYSWNTNFYNKFGMTFYYMDTLGYPTVNYKGQSLSKLQTDPMQGRVEITNAAVATRVATSTRPDGVSIGYITKGANMTYVADNPFSYTTYLTQNDRILAFEDTIHDVLGTNAAVNHRADLRIEDVSPMVPPANLKAIADVCAAQNVPFVVSVIPRYTDPLNAEGNGVTSYDMSTKKKFIAALQYMQSKGGKLIMHGYTHQYSNVPNPYSGESADDFEFFRVIQNTDGTQSYQGPVKEDSNAWAANRLDTGRNIFTASGLAVPDGWVTPHYLASPADYVEIQKRFKYSICRGLTFSQDASGNLRYLQQHSPWVYTDPFGMKRIPETVGYIDVDAYQGIPPTLPADLLKYIDANSVVRDGWAGMYFHWYLDPALLTQIITGAKAKGYKFVMPDATLL